MAERAGHPAAIVAQRAGRSRPYERKRMKSLAYVTAVGLTLVSASAMALTPKEVYKKAGPAVVLFLGSDDGKSGSGGTGSIITNDGKVVTNADAVTGR